MPSQELIKLLNIALEEDIPKGDITTELCTPQDISGKAQIIAKEEGMFFGAKIITAIFQALAAPIKITMKKQDGEKVSYKDEICVLEGSVKTILKAERTLLNLLQRLSGIATTTNKFVQALSNPNIKIMDTRKTTPGLRFLEKQAVIAGGGYNHRQGLSDMILLKENHLKQLENQKKLQYLSKFITDFKIKNPKIKVEVEVENLEKLKNLDLTSADYIMLDNFSISEIKKALTIYQEKGYNSEIEISGNVTLDNIKNYQDLAIQRISIGRLTHSVKAMDLSLLFL